MADVKQGFFETTVPSADSTDNNLLRDVGGNKTDAAVVAVGTTASLIAYVKGLIAMLGANQTRFLPSMSGPVEEDAFQQFRVSIFDIDGGAVAADDIDIGSIVTTLEKSTGGAAFSNAGITQPVFAKAAGGISVANRFLAAQWAVGDVYKLTTTGVTATVNSQTVYMPTMTWSNIVHEVAEIKADIDDIDATLGQLDDVAAAGAVTDADTAMQYLKQIINEINSGTWTNLSGGAISSLDGALQVIAAVLNVDGANTFSVGVDGNTDTDLDAIFTDLAAIIGARSTAASTGVVTATDTIVGYLKQAVTNTLSLAEVADGTDVYPASVANDSLFAKILGVGNPADASGYDNTTDSLKAQRENFDAVVGALATAAATGLVTSSDILMAYIKQIVTNTLYLAELADGTDAYPASVAADSIFAKIMGVGNPAVATGYDNTTDSLEAQRTNFDAVVGTVATAGTTGAVTSSDLIMGYLKQVVTNTYRLTENAVADTSDPVDMTTEVADDTIMANLLTRDGNTSDYDRRYHSLEAIALQTGLIRKGYVTTATSTLAFTSTDLVEPLAGKYIGWWVTCEIDAGGAGGAPQGEWRQVSASTAAGAITHPAFTAQTGVGDLMKLVPPEVYEAVLLRGGSDTIKTVTLNQQAELDIARGTSGVVTVDGGEDDIYNESSNAEFVLLQLVVDLNNMAEGDSMYFIIYTTEDGVERQISDNASLTFIGAQAYPRVEIVSSSNEVWGREGIRICAVKLGGTSREVTAYWRDGKRGF